MNQDRIAGAAVSTPLTTDLAIDHDRLVAHLKDLSQRGIDVFTLFGTTGEGTSFSRDERAATVARCNDAGIDASRLGSGIFSLSSLDAGDDCRAAFASGCGHVLLAPPCYYKGVDDEGLYRWFSETINATGPNPGHFILYHIPSMTQVELSVELVSRLAEKFPGIVTGVKDSSGNWPHTKRLIEERDSLKILVGHEGQLERGMRIGASGAIAGTGNVIPEVIRAIVHQGSEQPNLPILIDTLLCYPVIPAVKALIAHRLAAPEWLRVRPPLTAMEASIAKTLGQALDEHFPA